MIHDIRGKTVAVVLGVCLLGMGGCASSRSARFYTLSSLSASGEHPRSVAAEPGTAVAVGPVSIPDYLNRPQIISRSGEREIDLAEFERWAGSLEQDISRVLAENLSALLSKDQVTVLRSRDAHLLPVQYRIGVDVTRFGGSIGGTVTLAARWSLHREEDGKVLSVHESIFREPVEGQDYDDLVAAMSRALETLSREIAGAIPAR